VTPTQPTPLDGDPPPPIQQALRAHEDRWLAVASAAGFAVTRGDLGWVWYDGAGTIGVTPDDGFDPDDWLGQIVLHELCHHLVEGPDSRDAADWGLDNMSPRHEAHEHAALRLQAAICDRVDPIARRLFVATTDFRPFFEALPDDPLDAHGVDDPRSVDLARAGLDRFDAAPWAADVVAAMRAAVAFSRENTAAPGTDGRSP